MLRLNRSHATLSIFMVVALLLAACAPAVTPAATQAPPTQAPPTQPPAATPTVAAAAPTSAGPVKIGLFLPDKKTARYDTKDRPYFEAKMKELCPTCTVISDISDSDPVEQQNAVEQAITNGAKVVAIMAVDTKAAAVIADYAKKAGVSVIAYSRLLENSDGVTVNIAFQLADIGIAQAKSLLEALDKKGVANPKIVMINGSATDSNMAPIRDGAMSVFKPLVDAGKLTIVKTVDTPDWDPTKAQSEMEQILTETGGKIDGVYVMNDGMASGVVAAINSAGIKPVPPITGLDAELATIQRILTDQQYSTVYLPIQDMANKAAEIAYALATTGKVPDGMVEGKINNGSIDVPTVYIPVVNVDKTNIKEKIIDTGFWKLSDICTPDFADACKAAGLQPSGGSSAGPVKIGLFLPDKKTARYDTKDRPYFEAKMKELCPTCTVISDISDSDPVEQQNAVEQAITNGAKVVAIMAVDTKAAAVIADYAKKAGVSVIAYSRLLENSDGVTVNIAFQLADIGIAQAKSLLEALDKKGVANPKIVMINGSATDSNMAPIRDGAMSVFKPLVDAGKLTIVKTVDTPDWDPTKAQSEMEQILTETGGKIDGVYVMNDGMASGVVAAINSAGIKPVPPITGLDAELATIQRILTDQQYSTVYLPIQDMANKAAEIAYALATTGKVPDGMVGGKINNGSIDVPTVYIPVVNVDKTNIKEKIIDTGFWKLSDICTPDFANACAAAGLK